MDLSLSLTPKDYWSIIVRRKWLILGLTLVGVAVASVLSVVLPKSYRSSTLILVESQKIPERYVQGVVSGTVQERLSMIKQQVMSRTLLSKVIEEFDLFHKDRETAPLEAVIEKMRKDIKVETKGTGHVEAFSISFAHEDPVTAMKVTAKLASQFIEENLRIREQFVEGASEFLDQELKSAKEALEAKEEAISRFKHSHMGELPSQLEANLRALDRLQLEMNSVQELVPKLHERLDTLQRAIGEYDPSVLLVAPATSAGLRPLTGQGVTDPMARRLRELQDKLATMSGQYKDNYPDMVQLKLEIQKLQEQLGDSRDKDSKEPVQAEMQRGVKPLPPASAKIVDPYYLALVKQRDEVAVELSSLKERQRRLAGQIQEYERRVNRAPALEQELATLQRDYENMQKNYQSLLDKKLNARIAENLEKRQKGEQFRILDPANLPATPEKPNPFYIMVAGLVAGCGLGFAAAFSIELVNPPFRRSDEVEQFLGLPILASIPLLTVTKAFKKTNLPPSKLPRITGDFPKPSKHDSKTSERLLVYGSKFPSLRTPSRDRSAFLSEELNLVVKWRPHSVEAEQFRVAATRLALMEKASIFGITSAIKGEGKTTTAMNLGYTMAKDLGKRTLVIDCDFKCPALHKIAGVNSESGLADMLIGNARVEACTVQIGELPIWIIPGGRTNDHSITLSKAHQLSSIIAQVREQFDYIILDAPPILPVADMNVLAKMVDGLVLVVRAGRTPRQVVQSAVNRLKTRHPVGVVLNGVTQEGIPYYFQHYYQVRRGTEE